MLYTDRIHRHRHLVRQLMYFNFINISAVDSSWLLKSWFNLKQFNLPRFYRAEHLPLVMCRWFFSELNPVAAAWWPVNYYCSRFIGIGYHRVNYLLAWFSFQPFFKLPSWPRHNPPSGGWMWFLGEWMRWSAWPPYDVHTTSDGSWMMQHCGNEGWNREKEYVYTCSKFGKHEDTQWLTGVKTNKSVKSLITAFFMSRNEYISKY